MHDFFSTKHAINRAIYAVEARRNRRRSKPARKRRWLSWLRRLNNPITTKRQRHEQSPRSVKDQLDTSNWSGGL